VALVGGGGKTSALRTLAEELVAAGGRVIVATTTAMFLREMAVVGPVLLAAGEEILGEGVRDALTKGTIVALAHSVRADGKVTGLPPETIDELWAAGLADYLLVEADGSRGRSLKAFAPYEPQVPAAATTIVQMAGLDALGEPLGGKHVHRAEALAVLLARPLGSEVTARAFAESLRAQVPRLRQAGTAARIVTLLNKADGPDGQASGLAVARELPAQAGSSDRRSPEAVRDVPDAVCIASLRERRFARVSLLEG
jgi:probable selenium-dependent hydroxylase accessory protein YqeC